MNPLMANITDYDILGSEFKLQSLYYVLFPTNTFWKGMDPLISPAISEIVSLLFYKDCFGIKWPTKVDILLKQRKQALFISIILSVVISTLNLFQHEQFIQVVK